MKMFLSNPNISTEDLQIQVLITTIVLGVLVLVLAVFVILAYVMLFKIRKAINKLNTVDRINDFRIERVKSPYCFHNPTIQPHEELSRRGFYMYDGTDTSTLQNNTQF
ncbi:uncharacterized protein LOC123300777 isoform X2 [Chrysoperla carnea]|nr:uncharacterized protein LOC123300777 isoform X2 [Chrysoperla carnea]